MLRRQFFVPLLTLFVVFSLGAGPSVPFSFGPFSFGLFSHGGSSSSDGPSWNGSVINQVAHAQGLPCSEKLVLPTTSSYVSLPSKTEYDPVSAKDFVVAVYFQFSQLPPFGARQNIIGKYSSSQNPPPGWALAIQRFDTSVRPEVYWRDSNGKGGWFTFEKFDLLPRKWYGLTFVSTVENNLLLFLEESPTSQIETAEGSKDFGTKARYVGGYNVSDKGLVQSSGNLVLGSTSANWRNSFIGEISGAWIGHVSPLGGTYFSEPSRVTFWTASALISQSLDSSIIGQGTLLSCNSEPSLKDFLQFKGKATWQ